MRSFFRKAKHAILCVIEALVPKIPGRVVFMSYEGDYSDSPRLISERLHELCPDVCIRWFINSEKVPMESLPDYVMPVSGRRFLWATATAQVVVDNNFGARSFSVSGDCGAAERRLLRWWEERNATKVFSTWHGTPPMKRMGCDQVGNDTSDFFSPRLTLFLRDKFGAQVMSRLTFGKARCEITGSPRNDRLVNAADSDVECARVRVGVPEGKRAVLFAPTFRSSSDMVEMRPDVSGLVQLEDLDLASLLSSLHCRFGGEWVVVLRFHQHVVSAIDWPQLEASHPGVLVNGNSSAEMADCLLAADCLITDYSTCMFDYALLGRPCFLFCPDFEHYRDEERGFYFSPDSLPFPFSRDGVGILEEIRRFDGERYRESLGKMMRDFCFFEDGRATDRIARLLIDELSLEVCETRCESE